METTFRDVGQITSFETNVFRNVHQNTLLVTNSLRNVGQQTLLEALHNVEPLSLELYEYSWNLLWQG